MNIAEFREEVRQKSRRAQGHLVTMGVALLVFVIAISALFSLIPYLINQ